MCKLENLKRANKIKYLWKRKKFFKRPPVPQFRIDLLLYLVSPLTLPTTKTIIPLFASPVIRFSMNVGPGIPPHIMATFNVIICSF